MKRSLRSWLWRVPVSQEVEEELAFHVEMRTRELIGRGLDPQEARERAVARLGDATRLKRTCVDLGRKRDREMRLTQWLDEFRDDVKFAVRQMKASPAFTLVAALTLALGVGANSAIFALADAAMIRPLPFPAPDRLMLLSERYPNGLRGAVSPLDFVDWTEQSRTFEAMAAVLYSGVAMTGPDGVAESIPSQTVSHRFFDVLAVKPIFGRTFLPEDEQPVPHVIVMSEGFWRARYGADPSVVGREIRVDGDRRTVIGIVPAGAQISPPSVEGATAVRPASLWSPIGPIARGNPAMRRAHYFQVIGRLKPDVTVEAARSEMTAISEQLERLWPDTNKGHRTWVEPLRDGLVGREVRLTTTLIFGVVGFVLLLCCANVANLLLARSSVRAREMAVRSALGAGRRRIVAQLLTEGVVLALLGGAIGVTVGAAILSVAPSVIPPGLLPGIVMLQFDARVLVFCATATLVVGMVFGLVPAWQGTGVSLVQAIASDSRAATGRGNGLRGVVVVGEIAAAVLLLCGAGLLLRTLVNLGEVDPGYRAREVLTLQVNLMRYPTADSMRQFYEAVERETAGVPGVRHVAWGSSLPLDGIWFGQGFQIAGDPPTSAANRSWAAYHMVTPSYFDTLGIPVLAGRGFDGRDQESGPPVCIVDEAFVRRHLKGRQPLGMRLVVPRMTIGPEQPPVREIVGVVREVKGRPNESEPDPRIYVPLVQNTWWAASLVVQSAGGSAEALAPAVRAAVARVDKERPVTQVRTMREVGWQASARWRFRAVLVATFAALAVVMAMAGVFGVLVYSVQQRRREFGVRIALGATVADVMRLVITSAARVTLVGMAIGLAAAAIASQWIATLLFGVQPLDPMTFALAALVLTVTAAIATAAPALRASRVDPVVTFRAE